jgi:beta-glucosidase-like glycosyl hydrolase
VQLQLGARSSTVPSCGSRDHARRALLLLLERRARDALGTATQYAHINDPWISGQVNGIPTCLDGGALTGTLRSEFGFAGMVVSDCDSIADAVEPTREGGHGYAANASDATARGLLAGCDMDCGTTYGSGAAAAVASGALPTAALDAAIARPLAMRFRLLERRARDALGTATQYAHINDPWGSSIAACRSASSLPTVRRSWMRPHREHW